jgi:two-component system, sensor histidine kinase and response regulator
VTQRSDLSSPALVAPDAPNGDVLIVDDFADTLALYDALLTEDGHRVRTANSGATALKMVDEREPELVLLDVSMPGMDGVEVLRRLRARRGGGPAVIMLTAARREPHAIEAGLRQGADAYLTKPIDARELLARTRAALESFRLKKLLEAQRRDHIAMLVHDLRHPLSSLGLVAEVLDADDLSDEERRASVATIRNLSKDMARLIDGVLAASRLEAGVFTVEPRKATAGDVLKTALSVFTPIASRRRVALAFEGSLEQSVFADVPKLRQALDNLLANALKFTPKGGRVRVRVSRTVDATDKPIVTFEVSDSGPGIAVAERATIFDRYQQGSHGRAAGGAGLGLAIARGIAEAHGGSVSVDAGDLGGAAFKLSVPE